MVQRTSIHRQCQMQKEKLKMLCKHQPKSHSNELIYRQKCPTIDIRNIQLNYIGKSY